MTLILDGAGTGAVYALLGLSLVVLYRSGGVLNVAVTATGAMAGYVGFVQFGSSSMPPILSLLIAAATGAGIAIAFYVLYVTFLPTGKLFLTGTIATVGLTLILEALMVQFWGASTLSVHPVVLTFLPRQYRLPVTELVVLGILCLLLASLWKSRLGLKLRACDEGTQTAALCGVRVTRIQALTWGLAGLIAAIAGVLGAGTTGLSSSSLGDLLDIGLVGVVLGGFDSFGGVLVGGIGLGILQNVIATHFSIYSDIIVFGIALAVLAIRPNGVIGRIRVTVNEPEFPHDLRRVTLPAFHSRRLRPSPGVYLVIAIVVSLLTFYAGRLGNYSLVEFSEYSLGVFPAVLSGVFVVGYLGFFSLGQMVLGGVGAYAMALVAVHFGVPLWLGCLVGIGIAFIAGLVFGLVTGKISPIPFAVLTIAAGTALAGLADSLVSFTGGASGLPTPPRMIGALNLTGDPSFTGFELVLCALAIGVVALFRRSVFGKTLLLARESPFAAQSQGARVLVFKAVGFGIGAALAGLSGIVLAEMNGVAGPNLFSLDSSLNILVAIVIGGLTSVSGAAVGAIFLGATTVLMSGIGALQGAVEGGVLLAALFLMPQGAGRLLDALSAMAYSSARRLVPVRHRFASHQIDAEPTPKDAFSPAEEVTTRNGTRAGRREYRVR